VDRLAHEAGALHFNTNKPAILNIYNVSTGQCREGAVKLTVIYNTR
jgi:hypothetical protein